MKQKNNNPLLVTMALPYANGDIHLGHLVEAVQTDIFVRFNKLLQRDTIFVCADDTHGTPIQINAAKMGITPEELIAKAWKNHNSDYKGFLVDFDIFYTTNSDENRKWAVKIFDSLKGNGLIQEKTIEQYFCAKCGRFLPDRFIVGTCPKCNTEDQYGDVCESCGATYDPTDLKSPHCATCGSTPELKETSHYFVDLKKYEGFLRDYLESKGILQSDMLNFVNHWIDSGLQSWCISRDGPYFGFEIPGSDNKFFYVWLDAPIGYISSTEKLCTETGRNVLDYWGKNSDSEIVHFIGKDIVYFHTLFWPVMLNSADLKLPSKFFVHGFLTVQGEKMSKSRGTFILARDFLEKVKHKQAPEYLRFFYASKLSSNSQDIDFSIEEFVTKINTTLINNIGNFMHRTFVFLDRFFDSEIPSSNWNSNIESEVSKSVDEFFEFMTNAEYKSAVEIIHYIGNLANRYYQETKPWELVKNDKSKAAEVMVTCVNLARTLSILLKPMMPSTIEKIENQFDEKFTWEDSKFSLRGKRIKPAEKLMQPIEKADIAVIIESDDKIKEKTEEELIDIEIFDKVELKVGVVKDAEKIDKSDKLIKMQIDDGNRTRQIIGGIGKSYTPEELLGKHVVFVANLKPAKLMGELSEGMVLAAKKRKKLSLVVPEKESRAGADVS